MKSEMSYSKQLLRKERSKAISSTDKEIVNWFQDFYEYVKMEKML